MRLLGLKKDEAMRYGLGLLGLALLMVYVVQVFAVVGSFGALLYLSVTGTLAVSGFILLVVSLFLPKERLVKPTFTEEMMGKESLNYGVYTDGNWMSVLDEEDEKKQRHG